MANSSKLKLPSAHLLPRFFFSERNALLFLGRVHYLPEKSRKKMNSLADNYITPFLTKRYQPPPPIHRERVLSNLCIFKSIQIISQVWTNRKITNPVVMVQTVLLSWSLWGRGRSELSFCCFWLTSFFQPLAL